MDNYLSFMGIDLAKETLDICLFDGNNYYAFTVENSVKAIRKKFKSDNILQLINWQRTLICMEHTGIYNHHLLSFLKEQQTNIWLENPVHIKRSLGLIRGKNDKADAKRIVQFAFRNRDQVKLWQPQRPILQQLKNLTSLRNRLIKAIQSLEVPLAELKSFTNREQYLQLKKACTSSIAHMKSDLKRTDLLIKEIIKSDEHLFSLFTQITSVECIGPVTAANIIVVTNEFVNFSDPKKFACYSGIAPFEYSSGSSVRGKTRVSHMANKHLKMLLHMASLAAIRTPGELQTYYNRKITEGKNKMLVLNAIRNKLVLRIFACVKNQKLYSKNINLAA